MTDADRDAAKKRIKARREFWALLAVLVVISLFLIAIWFLTGAHSYFWPIWPLMGFVIAILFSGLNAFGVINREVTDADIDAELSRKNRAS